MAADKEKYKALFDFKYYLWDMTSEKNQWWKEQPFITVIYGIVIITLASIAKLISDWITIPLTISSFKEFYNAVIFSFRFVLNFDFKLWWVFLLIIYIMVRLNKSRD